MEPMLQLDSMNNDDIIQKRRNRPQSQFMSKGTLMKIIGISCVICFSFILLRTIITNISTMNSLKKTNENMTNLRRQKIMANQEVSSQLQEMQTKMNRLNDNTKNQEKQLESLQKELTSLKQERNTLNAHMLKIIRTKIPSILPNIPKPNFPINIIPRPPIHIIPPFRPITPIRLPK